MSHPSGPSLIGRGAAAFAAALALARPAWPRPSNAAAPAPAQPVQGLYQASSGATRYATPDGAVRFVFDRSGGRAALVRFEGDPEVHVLRPAMAAGGGEIYRTEDGDVMLRVTPHGSITVYTRAHAHRRAGLGRGARRAADARGRRLRADAERASASCRRVRAAMSVRP